MTDHPGLAQNLKPWICSRDHSHIQVAGSITPKTAYYNKLMCQVILSSIFPHKMSSHIPALTCTPINGQSMPSKGARDMHRTKDQRCPLDQGGLYDALIKTFDLVIETDNGVTDPDIGECDVILPAAVHQLLSQRR